MELLRIASAYFEPPPKSWEAWKVKIENVHVSTIPIREASPVAGKLRLLLQAATRISFPEINDDGYIVLPEDKRQSLEAALEIASNLLAVFGCCRRSLLAARPSVALVPKNNRQRKRLDLTKGFLVGPASTVALQPQIPIGSSFSHKLGDRNDGVALMAEALSHDQASGQFREYVRLFEAGFGMKFSQVSKKLEQFLHPGFGYTRAEIRNWINMRDPLIHADRAKSDIILVNADVRKVTQRMQQAAYDVLFNKAIWRDRSSSRRTLWTPPAVTASASCELVVRRGSEPTLRFQHFDEFGVFPLDLRCVLKPLPAHWWYKIPSAVEAEANSGVKPTA